MTTSAPRNIVRSHKRVGGVERKEQIVRATRELIARYGLHGTSVARISAAVGITDAALYKHFASKDDILIAAYDSMAARVFEWIASNADLPAHERIKRLGETHAGLFSKDMVRFNVPMFQFNVWLPEGHLRKHVNDTHAALVDALSALIEEGKSEGSLRADVDTEFIVSEIYAWIWWEDLSYLRGLDSTVTQKRSVEMFGRILQDIAVRRP